MYKQYSNETVVLVNKRCNCLRCMCRWWDSCGFSRQPWKWTEIYKCQLHWRKFVITSSVSLQVVIEAYDMCTANIILGKNHEFNKGYLSYDNYRAMLCIRGTSHGPVSVSVCLSVCLSDTSRCSTKTAKRRITQTTPHDTPGTLVFRRQKSPRNSIGVTPHEGAKCRWGGSKSATFDQ